MMLKVLRSTVCVAVLLAPALVAAQTPAPTPEEIKASANPELIGDMTKEMGITVPQASGAAGALFSLAKTRLKAEDFVKVASAVPGIDSLMAAAPAVAGTAGSAATGALAKATGAAGALGGLHRHCSSLNEGMGIDLVHDDCSALIQRGDSEIAKSIVFQIGSA